MTELDEFVRRQILAAAEKALRTADVVGIVPTPLDAVTQAVGLAPVVDIGELPPDIAAKKPRAWKRILGALVYRERLAFVDLSQTEPRARLTHGHEIGHRILPWHEGAFQLDGCEHLLGMTHDRLELEAYLAGGHLLFQGPRFTENALGYQVSIKTPIALAADYAASMHATIRYYAMHMPDPVAVLIAGRYTPATSVPVWNSIESPSFLAQFGQLAGRMPQGRLQIAGGHAAPLGDIAHTAMTRAEVAAKEVIIPDLRGERRQFVAEAFFNQHNLFVMVTEPRARRLGRRVRVQAG
jgi:hypothetical protein